ncbi:MAG: glycoside hydrolase family 25 protein [Chthoniobacteraceae bacterium]
MRRSALRACAIILVLAANGSASNSIVNLSHYDEMRPDFAQMRREGIVAAIHEATYPVGNTDEKYRQRQDEAGGAGLLWGAYHFADATDPIRQADRFLNSVAAHWRSAKGADANPGVLLVLDFEKNGHYPGGTMRVDQAVAFVERIQQRTGKYPGIYSGENRIRSVINGVGVSSATQRTLQKCWLWVANYHYPPTATSPWSGWHLWQYTGDGVCDLPRASYPIGVANIRRAERNIFRGSASDVRSFWERNAWNPTR